MLHVAVPVSRQLVLRPPAQVVRVRSERLRGARVVDGLRVVRLEVAVVAAAGLGVDALPLVEDVLRARATSPSRLLAACHRGVTGAAAVREAVAELSDGDLDVLVRRLRRALVAAGVRGLEVEVRFTSAAGATAYVDLLHRPSGTALEVDGRVSHDARFVTDRRRDRWLLREHQVRTVRIAASEVRRDLPGVVAELLPLLLDVAA